MYTIIITIVTCLTLVRAMPAVDVEAAETTSDPSLAQGTRDMTEEEARHVLDLLFSSRTASAQAFIDSLGQYCAGEPLYLMSRARILKDLLPVDDENKGSVKDLAGQIHAYLDQAIATCTARMEAGSSDERLLLLRGWAWMFNSYVRVFERSFWAAGSDARNGKRDLTEYLEKHPDEPIAAGTLGAFLYFADQLPVAVRFISKLFLLPQGDREEGLRLMEVSALKPSGTPDNRVILNSIYMLFEGRYEEGLAGFDDMLIDHPAYMELARPFLLLAPLVPDKAHAFVARADKVMRHVDTLPMAEVDQSSYWVLQFLRAYADRIYAPQRAIERLQSIVEENPPHPDWVPGYAGFELGRIYAMRGEFARAKYMLERIDLSETRTAYLETDVKEALSALKNARHSDPLIHPAIVSRMYRGDSASAERIIETVGSAKNATTSDRFYLGDAYLLTGRRHDAYQVYISLSNAESPPWDHTFLMLASGRAAELAGADGDYEKAEQLLGTAMKFYHREFLLDWVFEGRQRYYHRLAEGHESVKPTLYTSN